MLTACTPSLPTRTQIHDRTQEWRADGLPFDIPAGAGPNWGSDGGGYSRAVDDQQQQQQGGEGSGARANDGKLVDAARVQLLLGRRVEAKKRRDFGRADAIRLHVSARCFWGLYVGLTLFCSCLRIFPQASMPPSHISYPLHF